jgi:hypothetical protein
MATFYGSVNRSPHSLADDHNSDGGSFFVEDESLLYQEYERTTGRKQQRIVTVIFFLVLVTLCYLAYDYERRLDWSAIRKTIMDDVRRVKSANSTTSVFVKKAAKAAALSG